MTFGIQEDVIRRMQLTSVSFKKLVELWKHPKLVSAEVRILSFKAIVESVLFYNCGTWALTEALVSKIDCFHRKMLRRVLNVAWYDKVTNETLYKRCKSTPVSIHVINAR